MKIPQNVARGSTFLIQLNEELSLGEPSMNYVPRARAVAALLIKEMSLDNDVTFTPSVEHRVRLENAVCSLLGEGLEFDEDDILNIAAGEEGENEDTFGGFAGWSQLKEILILIFEGAYC